MTGALGQHRIMKENRIIRSHPENPAGLTRHVLRMSRSYGAISFTYHIAPAVSSPQISVPRLLFSNVWSVTNSSLGKSVQSLVERVHDQIIADGVPTTYRNILKDTELLESEATSKIAEKIKAKGIVDELIIPVYGPYKIEGCMCFGFDKDISTLDIKIRDALEVLATSSHVRIVSTFRDKIHKVQLSNRETEVLRWLAHGKSQSDIATILDIKATTVDSYTRRIYTKLGVNTKIAAVLAGISTGKISI